MRGMLDEESPNIFGDISFNDIRDFTYFLDRESIYNIIDVPNIIITISDFSNIKEFVNSLMENNFVIEKELGKLLYISKISDEKKVFFYVFYDDNNNIPLFFTDAKKSDDIPDILFRYFNKVKKVSNMWIYPKIMKKIKDNLEFQFDDMIITYFSAKRALNSDINAEFRPDVERNIQYSGEDGKRTLNEMEYYYGVLPKILDIKLPNGIAFKIDNKGIITLRSGTINDIFNIIEDVINRSIHVRDAISKSNYEIKWFGKNNRFSNAIQKPWSIKLQKGMKPDDIPFFCDSIQSKYWNFTVLEWFSMEKSRSFNARIIDNNTGSHFDISTSEEKIDIYPVEHRDLNASIHFYAFISENIDNTALVS
jgi:hypothetical protein